MSEWVTVKLLSDCAAATSRCGDRARARSRGLLAACGLCFVPAQKPRTTFYPCRPQAVGRPIRCSLGVKARQAREEARPFFRTVWTQTRRNVASGLPSVPLSIRHAPCASSQPGLPPLRRLQLRPSGTTPSSRKRHNAISSLRATATMPTLRSRQAGHHVRGPAHGWGLAGSRFNPLRRLHATSCRVTSWSASARDPHPR